MTQEVLRQTGGRTWSGWWPGVVVDNADPERRGRCRVRVAQIYGSEQEDEFIADDDLPWALPNGMHYKGTGAQWVPAEGQAVWVAFIAGDHTDPIYQGGWATEADTIPEHVSSYEPGAGPATRVIKTENGHLFEMRWKTGEVRITLQTAGLRYVVLDDTAQSATLATPTQRVELLDLVQTINVITPGIVNVSSGGAANITAGGAATISAQGITLASTGTAPTTQTGGGASVTNFVGAVANTYGGTYALTVVGVTTLILAAVTATIASITLTAALTITGVLAIGAVGVKRRLAHDQLMVLLAQLLYAYENHNHGGAAVPPTILVSTGAGSPPNPASPLVNVPAGNVSLDCNTMLTANLTAN